MALGRARDLASRWTVARRLRPGRVGLLTGMVVGLVFAVVAVIGGAQANYVVPAVVMLIGVSWLFSVLFPE